MAVEGTKEGTKTFPGDGELPSLSKNKLKKLERDRRWEAGREERKEKRKLKIKEKKERLRATRDGRPINDSATQPISHKNGATGLKNEKLQPSLQLPVTFVIDCSFDTLMSDGERRSLATQITRCYSDNHKSLYKAHLAISTFTGQLKERFDGILSGNHRSWKGVHFLEEDFIGAASRAKEWTKGPKGGELAGAFSKFKDPSESTIGEVAEPEVVYLSSDSSDNLNELKPYGTYVIGGLVDRNRHKGVCYKAAMDKGVRTAKLPIDDFMQMKSRAVLTVNQVSEILLRWLDSADWGKAFMDVMPKRKGGMLRGETVPKPGTADCRSILPGDEQSESEGSENVLVSGNDLEPDPEA